MIKPFGIFETKKKSDLYLENLNSLLENKDLKITYGSINERFISLINHVLNDELYKQDYLVKIIWLINTFKLNLPKYAQIFCSNSYTKDKNISSVIMFILLPFIKETFSNIKGIGHTESREIFSIFSSLYDINKTDNDLLYLDEKYETYLNETGFTKYFGNLKLGYSNDLYSIY